MTDIYLERIVKRFGPDALAVDDFSLHVAPGSFVCLLGPSGCGKTTTLRMISGLERVDSGVVTIGGEVFDSPQQNIFVKPENRRLGLVFQSYALWPHMTVEENVEFGLKMQRVDKEERTKIITGSLNLLRMESYRKRYPAQLSGGQQQRVALARMLAVQPHILLLDEPLSNLDAALRLQMRSELKSLHERLGNTIVFVTHDQLEAMSLATHVAVMNEGRLEQYADPMTIYQKPATDFVATFVGSPPMNMVEFSDATGWRGRLLEQVAQSYDLADRKDRIGKIGFRPEAVSLVSARAEKKEGSKEIKIAGRVKAVLPTGPEVVISVVVEESEYYVVAPTNGGVENGESVQLVVPLEHIHIFDRQGMRL
ncbi:MAG: ABC transporter ATP-binding protein [Sphaerochaeta sp.]|jgi:iron(III) transport system ATP-binding protein|nr:ABC transporter ATP-binding protein [Sphaerochaeta sp.]